DPVALALRGIGRRGEEAHPKAGDAEGGGQEPEPRDHAARKRIEGSRTRETRPADGGLVHSSATFSAAVVAQGAKKSASTSSAARSEKCPAAPCPLPCAWTAPAPNTSVGT